VIDERIDARTGGRRDRRTERALAVCVFTNTSILLNAGDRFVETSRRFGRSCPDFVSSQRASSVRFRENKKKTGTFRKQFRASRENIWYVSRRIAPRA